MCFCDFTWIDNQTYNHTLTSRYVANYQLVGLRLLFLLYRLFEEYVDHLGHPAETKNAIQVVINV